MSRGAAVEDASRGGPTDGTAFVLIIGRADRFQCGQQIASYLGLIPLEESSGERRRLGHITKPGNSRLRFLLVEAVQVTVRRNPPSDVVFPSNFRRLLIEYQEHPEAKSLAPDGTLCKMARYARVIQRDCSNLLISLRESCATSERSKAHPVGVVV